MRYIIGFLVTIGLIVLVLFLILSGGGSAPKTAPKTVNVLDYANSATARAQLIIQGPVVADQNYRELEIDVTQGQVALTVYRGYQRTIVRTKSYTNNPNAFSAFMYGLQRANFYNGTPGTPTDDERGFCVEGTRNLYTLNDGNKDIIHYWQTSCGQGTFKGDADSTTYLFTSQVPDYHDLVADLNFAP